MNKCKQADCTMHHFCRAVTGKEPMSLKYYRYLMEKAQLKLECCSPELGTSENPCNILSGITRLIRMKQVQGGFEACFEEPFLHEFERIGFELCQQLECSFYAGCLFGNYERQDDFSWEKFITQVVAPELEKAQMGNTNISDIISRGGRLPAENIERVIKITQRKGGFSTCFRLGERTGQPMRKQKSS